MKKQNKDKIEVMFIDEESEVFQVYVDRSSTIGQVKKAVCDKYKTFFIQAGLLEVEDSTAEYKLEVFSEVHGNFCINVSYESIIVEKMEDAKGEFEKLNLNKLPEVNERVKLLIKNDVTNHNYAIGRLHKFKDRFILDVNDGNNIALLSDVLLWKYV